MDYQTSHGRVRKPRATHAGDVGPGRASVIGAPYVIRTEAAEGRIDDVRIVRINGDARDLPVGQHGADQEPGRRGCRAIIGRVDIAVVVPYPDDIRIALGDSDRADAGIAGDRRFDRGPGRRRRLDVRTGPDTASD